MKTPIACSCAVCSVDLTAKVVEIERTFRNRGRVTTRKMKALRAPPRARIIYEVSGGVAQGVKRLSIDLWLCEAHAHPGTALGALSLRLAEREGARIAASEDN